MSPNLSGSADPPPLPWVYDYEEEVRRAGGGFLDKPLFRPVVPVRLAGPTGTSQRYVALVDSGCDHVLAPLWLAETIGVDPDEDREIGVGIGGKTRVVRFADVEMQLVEPAAGMTDADAHAHLEWRCQVGFFVHWADPPWMVLLGQVGFFDQFTVSLSRLSQRLSVSPQAEFDDWFPSVSQASPPLKPPRLRP